MREPRKGIIDRRNRQRSTDWLRVLLVRWMLLGPQVSIDILVDVWWGHMGRRLVRTSHRRGII